MNTLTVAVAARMLNVTVASVRGYCLHGKIAAQRTGGGHYRIPIAEVKRLQEAGAISDPMPREETLSVTEVAAVLRVSVSLIRSYCQRHLIASSQTPGGHYRVPRKEVERLREERVWLGILRAGATPQPVAPSTKVLLPEGARPACVVYLVRAGDAGPIKIGYATNFARRLKELQFFNHEPLTALAVIPGGRSQEHMLHERFAHLRIHGEWFRPGVDLLAFVATLQSG